MRYSFDVDGKNYTFESESALSDSELSSMIAQIAKIPPRQKQPKPIGGNVETKPVNPMAGGMEIRKPQAQSGLGALMQELTGPKKEVPKPQLIKPVKKPENIVQKTFEEAELQRKTKEKFAVQDAAALAEKTMPSTSAPSLQGMTWSGLPTTTGQDAEEAKFAQQWADEKRAGFSIDKGMEMAQKGLERGIGRAINRSQFSNEGNLYNKDVTPAAEAMIGDRIKRISEWTGVSLNLAPESVVLSLTLGALGSGHAIKGAVKLLEGAFGKSVANSIVGAETRNVAAQIAKRELESVAKKGLGEEAELLARRAADPENVTAPALWERVLSGNMKPYDAAKEYASTITRDEREIEKYAKDFAKKFASAEKEAGHLDKFTRTIRPDRFKQALEKVSAKIDPMNGKPFQYTTPGGDVVEVTWKSGVKPTDADWRAIAHAVEASKEAETATGVAKQMMQKVASLVRDTGGVTADGQKIYGTRFSDDVLKRLDEIAQESQGATEDAVQKQVSEAGVLRQEQPQVGLPGNGEGNAEIPTGEGQTQTIPQAQEEVITTASQPTGGATTVQAADFPMEQFAAENGIPYIDPVEREGTVAVINRVIADPQWKPKAEALVQHIRNTKQGVGVDGQASLVALYADYARELKRIQSAIDQNGELPVLLEELRNIKTKLADLGEANEQVGTDWSKGGNLRQVLANIDDTNVIFIARRLRKESRRVGGNLSEADAEAVAGAIADKNRQKIAEQMGEDALVETEISSAEATAKAKIAKERAAEAKRVEKYKRIKAYYEALNAEDKAELDKAIKEWNQSNGQANAFVGVPTNLIPVAKITMLLMKGGARKVADIVTAMRLLGVSEGYSVALGDKLMAIRAGAEEFRLTQPVETALAPEGNVYRVNVSNVEKGSRPLTDIEREIDNELGRVYDRPVDSSRSTKAAANTRVSNKAQAAVDRIAKDQPNNFNWDNIADEALKQLVKDVNALGSQAKSLVNALGLNVGDPARKYIMNLGAEVAGKVKAGQLTTAEADIVFQSDPLVKKAMRLNAYKVAEARARKSENAANELAFMYGVDVAKQGVGMSAQRGRDLAQALIRLGYEDPKEIADIMGKGLNKLQKNNTRLLVADLFKDLKISATGDIILPKVKTKTIGSTQLEESRIKQAILEKQAEDLRRSVLADNHIAVVVNGLKNIGMTAEEINQAWKGALATGDLSAFGRQNVFYNLAHAGRGAGADFVDALKAAKDPLMIEKRIRDFESSTDGQLAIQNGLHLSRINDIAKSEELYKTQFLSKLKHSLSGSKGGRAIAKVVEGSEANFVAQLNNARIRAWNNAMKVMGQDATPDDMNRVAKFINAATGRGNIDLGRPAQFLLFSPRFLMSRFELAASLNQAHSGGLGARMYILKEQAHFAAKIAAVYKFAEATGAELDMNPTSPRFGRIIYRNFMGTKQTFELDPLGALGDAIRLSSQLAFGVTTNKAGEVTKLREFGNPRNIPGMAGDWKYLHPAAPMAPNLGTGVGLKYLMGRESPAASLIEMGINSQKRGTDIEDIEGTDYIKEMLPLTLGDTISGVNESGPVALVPALMTFFGFTSRLQDPQSLDVPPDVREALRTMYVSSGSGTPAYSSKTILFPETMKPKERAKLYGQISQAVTDYVRGKGKQYVKEGFDYKDADKFSNGVRETISKFVMPFEKERAMDSEAKQIKSMEFMIRNGMNPKGIDLDKAKRELEKARTSR